MERTIVYYGKRNIMKWRVNLELLRGDLIRMYIEIDAYSEHLEILVRIRLVCFWSRFPGHSPICV